MITITCKCKKSTQLFKNMGPKDFPNGWETDCCKEAEYKAAEDAVFAEPEVQAVLEDLAPNDVAPKEEKPKKKRKSKKDSEAPKAE